MLNFHQLTKQQRAELKESLLTETRDTVSIHDLVNAETIVSDDELNAKYGDTVFSPDDFCDTTGMTDSDCILQHYKDFRLTCDIDTIVEEIQKTANAAAEAILTDAQLDQDKFRNDLVESIYNAIADQIIGKA